MRRAIEDIGGTMPEHLPTPDRSIQDIERDEQRRLQQDAQTRRQPTLFGPAEDD